MDYTSASKSSKRGPAFLLIIPGSLLISLGIGLVLSNPFPALPIGLGAGLLVWGLIVALRK